MFNNNKFGKFELIGKFIDISQKFVYCGEGKLESRVKFYKRYK